MNAHSVNGAAMLVWHSRPRLCGLPFAFTCYFRHDARSKEARPCKMANPEHLRIARQCTDKWNAWRYANEMTISDLSGADLREEQLDEAFLGFAELNGVDLSGASFTMADL